MQFFPQLSMHLLIFSELSFKRRLLLFLQENQFYIPDFRFNLTLTELSEEEIYDLYEIGNFEITATRAKFQHSNLANTTIRIKAMHELRDGLSEIKFERKNPTFDESTYLFLLLNTRGKSLLELWVTTFLPD